VVTFDGTKFHLELTAIAASYDATLDASGTKLVGHWKQSGVSLPLDMIKVDDPDALAIKRPQEPKPPFPYESHDVTFPNGDVTLAGTLTFPRGAAPYAAAILVTGTGPQDRDESIMAHKPFLVLADHLTRQGIAVLRVDDRGVGGSTGSFDAATTEEFASDVEASIAFLTSRDEIDAKRIGLIGHSEGGITAPVVAARSKDVAFMVLMAGVGVPIEELLREQSRLLLKVNGATNAAIAANDIVSARLFAAAKSEPDPVAREAKVRAVVDSLMHMTTTPAERDGLERSAVMVSTQWMYYLLNYDPAATLRRIAVPVLAVNGELDLQVPPSQNLPAIRTALEAGGNRDVTVIEFPKLNHLFQTATTGSLSEYGTIEETIAPVVLQTISDWILARTRAKK
jgi:pimeloyl-ACP methyl ester carboxylesterase